MKTLDQMVTTGEAKMRSKLATMKTNYDAAKNRAKTGYSETPFSAAMKSAYNAGIDRAEYVAPDPAKWARNWRAKVTGA